MSQLRRKQCRRSSLSESLIKLVSRIGSLDLTECVGFSKLELKWMLERSENYDEWLDAARRLDVLEGLQEWRRDPTSPFYDHNMILERIQEMQRLSAEGDIGDIIPYLRSGLMRNLGGINDARLFEQEVCFCEESTLPLDAKLSFFLECRHAIGKTALLLSAGFTNIVSQAHHFGVIKALHEQGLLPRVISGRSTGAIVIAMIATRTSAELDEVLAHLLDDESEEEENNTTESIDKDHKPRSNRIRLSAFCDSDSSWTKFWRWLRTGAAFDVDRLREALRQNVGDLTFHEAYTKTGFIANILVSASDFESPRLLNYLTAPDVLIWSAALASCAFPGIYNTTQLIAKCGNDWVPYVMGQDPAGSVRGREVDLPFQELKVLFNVNFFIVSQINPHAIPFVQRPRGSPAVAHAQTCIKQLVGAALAHYVNQAITLRLAPKFLATFVNQKYWGDTTISPIPSLEVIERLFFSRKLEVLPDFLLGAERRTWIRIAKIRSNCEIEFLLEKFSRYLAKKLRDRADITAGMDIPAELSDAQHALVNQLDSGDVMRPRSISEIGPAAAMTGRIRSTSELEPNCCSSEAGKGEAPGRPHYKRPDVLRRDIQQTDSVGNVSLFRKLLYLFPIIGPFCRSKDTESRLQKEIQDAKTYGEWLQAAQAIDEIHGWRDWREKSASEAYDAGFIRKRLEDLKTLEKDDDVNKIVFWLRSGMVRDLGGTANPRLDDSALTGTKFLIEEHQEAMMRLLFKVASCSQQEMSLEKRLMFFSEASHVLGKTALLLSGGAGFGVYHFGIVKTLKEHGLLPRIISGSSVGSIIASFVCIHTEDELDRMFAGGAETICQHGNLNFYDSQPLVAKFWRLIRTGYWMDADQLRQVLMYNIGNLTFYEAYKRTGFILNIPVSPGDAFEKPRLLNYITAPNVLIWSASMASCSCPHLFESAPLMAKGKSGEPVPFLFNHIKWSDGSICFDLPKNPLRELFNADYMIALQVNPHIIPFVQNAQQSYRRAWKRVKAWPLRRGLRVLRMLLKSEVLFLAKQIIRTSELCGLGRFSNMVSAIIHQDFTGDCTFVPPFDLRTYPQVLRNPDVAALEQFMPIAEKLVWPNLAAIRRHSELQLVLDECVKMAADALAAQHCSSSKQESAMSLLQRRRTHLNLDAGLIRAPSTADRAALVPASNPLARGDATPSTPATPDPHCEWR